MPGVEIAAVESFELWRYIVLFVAVAASWIGIPIVGGAALAAAGVLAHDGRLDVWLVLVVASAGAWTGGYVGYLVGARAGDALGSLPGRRQRQRRRALAVGERFYGRWGPLAVFMTPTWVAGALRMRRNSFLIWNGLAAVVSSLVAVFGAYAIAGALLDHLSAPRGVVALAAALAAAAVAGVAIYRGRVRRTAE
jgi:membrane protein DedA with SNARE-associated domain